MTKEHIVVGLDIGTTKICAVVGEVLSDHSVNVIGIGSHRSTGLRKGMVVNIDSTVESIKRAVEEAELMAAVQINSVYTGIAGSHIGSESAQGVVALKKREVTKSDIRRAVDTARGCAVPPPDRLHKFLVLYPTVKETIERQSQEVDLRFSQKVILRKRTL